MDAETLTRDVYEHFRLHATWPRVRQLQSQYGSGINVRAVAAAASRDAIVCQEGPDATCFITLKGLWALPEAAEDMTNLASALRVVAEDYKKNGSRPIPQSAFAQKLDIHGSTLRRLGFLLDQVGRVFAASSWSEDRSEFSVTPDEEAIFYDSVQTYAAVVGVQARLQAENTQISHLLADEYRRARNNTPGPTPADPERYRLQDQELDDLLQRDLTELQCIHTAGAWKATAILAGSCLETLLLDLCQRNARFMEARFRGRWPEGVGANDLLKAAEASGLIDTDVHGLGNALRRWRNLVHPAAARRSREPTQELANALVANLRLLVADLSRTPVRE